MFGYLIWLLAAIWILRSSSSSGQPRDLSYSDFMAEVAAGHLQEVKITDRQLIGTLKPDQVKEEDRKRPGSDQIATTRIPGLDAAPLVQQLEAQNVKFSGYMAAPSWWTGLLISWGPLLLLFLIYGVAMWRIQQKGGGPLSFGRNRAKIHDESERYDAHFDDVAGVEEAKGELQEIIDFLKNPQKYQKLGGRIPKGVLVVGPPGTGKTLLARAVAGEASVPFFSISGSEFIQMFVGVGASRVRDMFKTAKENAPSLLFIDEIDAVGRMRGAGVGGGSDEREQTLNQILSEMDGFQPNEMVIVLAATNRPDVLDSALLRPGRFDRHVTIDRPTWQGRLAILKVHTRNKPLADEVNLEEIARGTIGMTGADLRNLANEAALLATREGKSKIDRSDFERAADRVMMGPKREEVLSPEDK